MTRTPGSDMEVEPVEWPPRFQFASEVWPGLAKLLEECGEIVQVAGKIIGTAGTMRFQDGQTVDRLRFVEELADLEAILTFVVWHDLTDAEIIALTVRSDDKRRLFERWRESETRANAT